MTHDKMNTPLPLLHGGKASRHARLARRSGFTLIEVMVALAILMVMLVIMFVPINMGVSVTQIGRTRADVQQTSQLTINRLEAELRQAMIVFPNDALPGVTNKAPYASSQNPFGYPYYQIDRNTPPLEYIDDAFVSNPTDGACTPLSPTTTVTRVGNTSRIDFILPKRDTNGQIETPLVPENYVITYYARRIYLDKLYDPVSNPVELFRAETPIGSTTENNTVSAGSGRYPTPGGAECTSQGTLYNKRAAWLYQSKYGEPNLDIKEFIDPPTPSATHVSSHTMVTPRDMGLITPMAYLGLVPSATPEATPSYRPSTSFICEDSDNDGKIDRVKISLTLAKFDANGSSAAEQRIPLSTIVTLPNVR